MRDSHLKLTVLVVGDRTTNTTILGRQIIINAASPAALVQVVTVAVVAAGAVVLREADPDPVNRRMIVDEGRNTSIGTGARGSTAAAVAVVAATEIERRNTTNIVIIREKVINIVADGITRTKKIVIGALAASIEKVIRLFRKLDIPNLYYVIYSFKHSINWISK